jgi:hypothetical protein
MMVKFMDEDELNRALASPLFTDYYPVGNSGDMFEVIFQKSTLEFKMCHWIGFQVCYTRNCPSICRS